MSDQPDKDNQARSDTPAGQGGEPEPTPADAFKQGMGLLWKAARSTVDEIKTEVNKGGVGDALKQAGRDLEDAANQAAKTLESFIDRVGPHETPAEQQGWPGAPGADTAPVKPAPDASGDEAPQTDTDTPEPPAGDGDMRIQIDDD